MGYTTVARLFHWVTVLLVLVMIPVGLVMAQEPPQPWQDRLYILHKGLGPFVLLVVLTSLWGVVYAGFMQLIALKTRSAAATNSGGLIFFPLLFLTPNFVPRDLLTEPVPDQVRTGFGRVLLGLLVVFGAAVPVGMFAPRYATLAWAVIIPMRLVVARLTNWPSWRPSGI